MSTRLCLITNNSTLRACTIGNSSIDFSIQLLEGSPFDVLMGGRDLIHQGWRLLNHPLYGNFRPGQQAMRSLLLLILKKTTKQQPPIKQRLFKNIMMKILSTI